MPRNSNRGGRNNNPTGRNQYSDWGVVDMVRERPIAAAAAAAGAAATGLFLWSKRAQISDQLSNLSEQVGQWRDGMRSGNGGDFETTAAPAATSRSGAGSASASNRNRSGSRRPTQTSSPG